MVDKYFFKFFIPQSARTTSNTSPVQKKIDGIPSTTKLIIRPDAKPNIKKIFAIVAVRQKYGLNIPASQSATIPKYKPIVALNTCVKSVLSTLKSKILGKILFGNKPYAIDTIVTIITDVVKCTFLPVINCYYYNLKAAIKFRATFCIAKVREICCLTCPVAMLKRNMIMNFRKVDQKDCIPSQNCDIANA